MHTASYRLKKITDPYCNDSLQDVDSTLGDIINFEVAHDYLFAVVRHMIKLWYDACVIVYNTEI